MRRVVLAALAHGDEQLHRSTDLPPVLFETDPVLQRDEPFVPFLYDRLRDLAGMVAAGVPARMEYWKVKALANRAASTTRSVSWKSASVSPGNPTMMSVEIAACGILARTRSRIPRKRSDR